MKIKILTISLFLVLLHPSLAISSGGYPWETALSNASFALNNGQYYQSEIQYKKIFQESFEICKKVNYQNTTTKQKACLTSTQVLSELRRIQLRLAQEDKFTDAESYSSRTILFLKNILGPYHRIIAELTTGLATSYAITEKPKKAEEAYKQAIEIYEKLRSNQVKSSSVIEISGEANTYEMQAMFYQYNGHTELANIARNNAIQILKSGILLYSLSPRNKYANHDIADLKDQLSGIYKNMGQYVEAKN